MELIFYYLCSITKDNICESSVTAAQESLKNLEPIIRNNNSGHDDNVESLTDNADGNDVGIKEILAANE